MYYYQTKNEMVFLQIRHNAGFLISIKKHLSVDFSLNSLPLSVGFFFLIMAQRYSLANQVNLNK